MQAYSPLHYYCIFSKRICFAHGITSWWVLPLFWHAISWIQQFRILPSKRDLEASLLRSTKHWSFHHSIEPSDDRGVKLRDQLAHKAHLRQWTRQLSWVQDTTEPMTKIAYDRSRWVQDDINYFQWLQSTTGHRRTLDCTPEHINSRRKAIELRDQMAHKACRRY